MHSYVLTFPWAVITVGLTTDPNGRNCYSASWNPPLAKRYQRKIDDLLSMLSEEQVPYYGLDRMALCLRDASTTVSNSRPRIQRIVDRLHVSATNDDGMAEVLKGMAPEHRWMLRNHPTMWKRTREIVSRRLAANRKEYRWVMRGCR